MVQIVGLRLLVVLVVLHEIFAQQRGAPSSQLAYSEEQHRSYVENVRHSAYGHQMQQPQTVPEQPDVTETRIIKHPDEKIVHHPSPIYVKRPPTYVTINHPDIVIEPSPVVYHKPAAVVRAPVIYKHLPQKVQYRHEVKHIVKPIERKIVLEEKSRPHLCSSNTFVNQNQQILQPKYYITQQSEPASDATDNVQYQQYNSRPSRHLVYQPEATSGSDETEGHVMDNNQYAVPSDNARVYYRHSYPSNFQQ